MTRIYLIRHAEAEGNLYRRVHGHYNSRITENGLRQIKALRNRFEGEQIDAVYSSDLLRAQLTAKALCEPRNLSLRLNKQLREISLGVLEDLPWGEAARRYGDQMHHFLSAPDQFKMEHAETFADLAQRIYPVLRRIVRRHDGQTVAIFSHGMVIRTAICLFTGVPLEEQKQVAHSDNTAVTLLECDGDKCRLVYANDNSHLGPLSTLDKQKWWRTDRLSDDPNLWYLPLDLEQYGDVYEACRKEAWISIHGDLQHFDGKGFLEDARTMARQNPNAVLAAMWGDELAGILQLDFLLDAEKGVGRIPFYYLRPKYRHRGIGPQLLGQAVSIFRPMGRRYLRLRCAPTNTLAQHFYQSLGFYKIGEDPGSRVPLDILELYIGLES